MIIFLYGLDTYRSRQKLNEIIEKYKAKHKVGLNLCRIDLSEKDLNSLKEATETTSMFSEKKLIIVENIFGAKEEKQKRVGDYLEKPNILKDEDVAVVIFEKGVPDKRTRLFKSLIRKDNMSQEFSELTGVRLESWIKKEVEKRGAKIDASAVKKMAVYSRDLWQLSNEIDKLIAFKKHETIIGLDIDSFIKPKLELNIFNTIDALGRKDKKTALRLLHQHLTEGENEIYLLSMFAYQFRNLLVIRDLLEKGVQPFSIAKKAGLHPFVVKKSLQSIKNFSLEQLKKMHLKLLDLDIKIKTGQIEAKAALDVLVMGI